MAITSSRRTFIKVGLAGAVVLATAGAVYRVTSIGNFPAGFSLDDEGSAALRAISGVLLQGAIAPDAQHLDMAVSRTLGTISGLPLATQNEIQDLFGLLTFAPARHFLAGIPTQWSQATQGDVAAFLSRWRVHRLDLLQSAYHALRDLIIGGWYADESAWESIGYPGPMKALS
jgi:hypothetical protein